MALVSFCDLSRASLHPAARADRQHIGRGAEAAKLPACEILGPGDK